VNTIDNEQFEQKVLRESINTETILAHQLDEENERERKDREVLNEVVAGRKE